MTVSSCKNPARYFTTTETTETIQTHFNGNGRMLELEALSLLLTQLE